MIGDIKQINPKYWGKSTWKCLSCMGLTYSNENKENFKIFFEKLGSILPCEKCREHYNQFLPKLDSALENKETFIDWLLEIRNDINIKSSKKILTKDDIITEVYFDDGTNSLENFNNQLLKQIIILIVILFILIIFFICVKMNY